MKILNTILLSLAIFLSCKKDKNQPNNNSNYDLYSKIDTIYPNNYFPVFPNSHWVYLINDSIFDTISTSSNYILHNYMNQTYPSTYSKYVYVPFLENQPIYGYNKLEKLEHPFGVHYILWPVLSEEIGYKFDRSWSDTRFGNFREHLVVSNKFILGSDSIISLKGNYSYGQNITKETYEHYAKNIGLTFHCVIDTVTKDTTYKKTLITYKIGK